MKNLFFFFSAFLHSGSIFSEVSVIFLRGLFIVLLVQSGTNDATAQTFFQKSWSKSSDDENIRCLQKTSDGNLISVGKVFLYTNYVIHVSKINQAGEMLWSKVYYNEDPNEGHFIKETSDGGFIVTGEAWGREIGETDIFVLKLDSVGNLQWSKVYGTLGYESGNTIALDQDGYLIVGYAYEYQNKNILLIKIDKMGNVVWKEILKGSGASEIFATEKTNDGYLLSGNLSNPSWEEHYGCLIKISDKGDLVWSKAYSVDQNESFRNLKKLNYNYVLVGYSSRKTYLVKVDENGDVLWSKFYASDWDSFGCDIELSGNDFIVAGNLSEANTSGENEGRDVFTIKTNTSGNLLWAKTYNSELSDFCYDAVVTEDGSCFIGGQTARANEDNPNIYLAKIDKEGNNCNESGKIFAETKVETEVVDALFFVISCDSVLEKNFLLEEAFINFSENFYCSSEGNIGGINNPIYQSDSLNFNLAITSNGSSFKLSLGNQSEVYEVLIYDILGKEIARVEVAPNEEGALFEQGKFRPGIYISSVKIGNNIVLCKKFVLL